MKQESRVEPLHDFEQFAWIISIKEDEEFLTFSSLSNYRGEKIWPASLIFADVNRAEVKNFAYDKETLPRKRIFFRSIVFPPVRTKYKEERRKKRREGKQSEIVSSDSAMLRERKSNAHEAGYPQLLLQTRPG